MSSSPAVAGFLGYISVATKIPHDVGLAPTSHTGPSLRQSNQSHIPQYEFKAAMEPVFVNV